MYEKQTITLGMGCFWSPEALFGALPGVTETRVGYAGGTTGQPTYREMGDHSETVEISFDAELIAADQLLETFWNNHNPVNINGYKGRQYQSLLLYRDTLQAETFNRVKKRVEAAKGQALETEIAAFEAFYPAEPRHQKYYLKRYPDAVDRLSGLYESEEAFLRSTLAARLNGIAKGYANLGPVLREIQAWPMNPDERNALIEQVRNIRW